MSLSEFITKRMPFRPLSEDPSVAVRLVSTGMCKRTINNNETWTAKTAMQHPVVYRCVMKIARAMASVQWEAVADPKATVKEAPSDTTLARIQAVLDNPTDDMTAYNMRFWMAMNFALIGRLGLKVGINSRGLPQAFYPLQPGKLEAHLNKRGKIGHYTYGDSSSKETLLTRRSATPGGDLSNRPNKAYVAEIWTPNITADPTSTCDFNVSPLHPISKPARVIDMLLQRAEEAAAGTPNSKYILIGDKKLSVLQEEAIRDFVYNSAVGGEESGNVLMLSNTSITVEKLDNDLTDIHTKIPADDMARHIAGIFGVPIALLGLGAADAAKFTSNYENSRLAFYMDTVIPQYLEPVADGLTSAICPPGVIIRFANDEIPSLREIRAVRARTLKDVTFMKINEKREMCGLPPIKEGDVLDPGSGSSFEDVGTEQNGE